MPNILLTYEQKAKFLLYHWQEYVLKQGQAQAVVVQVDGSFEGYRRTCEELKGREEAKYLVLHRSTHDNDGKPIELLHFPYYDVEAVCDDRASGGFGFTGQPSQIAKVSQLMGLGSTVRDNRDGGKPVTF